LENFRAPHALVVNQSGRSKNITFSLDPFAHMKSEDIVPETEPVVDNLNTEPLAHPIRMDLNFQLRINDSGS
jgi:hypothetical protein